MQLLLLRSCVYTYSFLCKYDQITGEPLEIRKDDDPKTLVTRLEGYHKETTPVLEFYKKQGVLANINADQAIEKVWGDIQASINGKKQSLYFRILLKMKLFVLFLSHTFPRTSRNIPTHAPLKTKLKNGPYDTLANTEHTYFCNLLFCCKVFYQKTTLKLVFYTCI